MVVLAPTELGKFDQDFRLFHFLREIVASRPAARVSAVEDQMAHPLRVAGCVLDGNRSAPAIAQQRKLRETGSLYYAFKIPHPGFEGNIADVTIRKTAAALVV